MGSPSLFITTSCQSGNVFLVFQVYATCSSGGVSGQLLKHEQQSSSCLCLRSRLLVFLRSCGFFGLSHHHSTLKHQELSLEPVRNIIQSRILSQIFFFQSFRFEQYKSEVYDHAHMIFKEPAIGNFDFLLCFLLISVSVNHC